MLHISRLRGKKVCCAFEYQRLRLNEAFKHTPTDTLDSMHNKWVEIGSELRQIFKVCQMQSPHLAAAQSSESSTTVTARQIYGGGGKNSFAHCWETCWGEKSELHYILTWNCEKIFRKLINMIIKWARQNNPSSLSKLCRRHKKVNESNSPLS